MLKLRGSPAPATAPDKKLSTTRAILVDRIVKEHAALVPVANHKHYVDVVTGLVTAALAARSGGRVDLVSLRAHARDAAETLARAHDGFKAKAQHAGAAIVAAVDTPPATAAADTKPVHAIAPAKGAAGRIGDLSLPVSPMRPSASMSRTIVSARSTKPGADSVVTSLSESTRAPEESDLSSTAGRSRALVLASAALETVRSGMRANASASELPVPMAVRKVQQFRETRDALTRQMAERQERLARERAVEGAFGAATKERVLVAQSVEDHVKVQAQHKALDGAAAARAFMKSQRELAEASKAAMLREEEAWLERLRQELEKEQADADAAQAKERAGIVESMHENMRLKEEREAARKRAVVEERRLQQAYERQVEEAEKAHKDKYKHIAERQDALAQQLLTVTAKARKQREEWERKAAEEAIAKEKADQEDEARRRAASKQRLVDTVSILHGMMAEKAVAKAKQEEEDVALNIATQQHVKQLQEEAAAARDAKHRAVKEHAEALKKQLETRKAIVSAVSPHASLDGTFAIGTSLYLPTVSSDADTDEAFIRTLRGMVATGPAQRGNASEGAGPLLGFGAPFATVIEAQAAPQSTH